MTSPNPWVKTARADRIEQYESLLEKLGDALNKKAYRGSVEVGELKVAYSNLNDIQKLIDTYTSRLRLLRRPQGIRV